MTMIADIFAATQDSLPAALVSAAARRRLAAAAALLPARLCDGFGFEVRLSGRSRQVDLTCRQRRENIATLIAGDVPFPDLITRNQKLAGLAAFYREWHRKSSRLYRYLDAVWLEFDCPPGKRTNRTPAFFFTVSEHPGGTYRRADTAFLQYAFALLYRQPLRRPLQRSLEKCVAALPRGAAIKHGGGMFSRRHHGIRIATTYMPCAAVVPFVKQLNWQGDIGRLANLAGRLAVHTPTLSVDIDVLANGIGPTLGVVIATDELHTPVYDERAETLPEILDTLAITNPVRHQSLREWRGKFIRYIPTLKKAQLLQRELSHVKFTFKPKQPLVVKAYFGLAFKKLTPAILRRHSIPVLP